MMPNWWRMRCTVAAIAFAIAAPLALAQNEMDRCPKREAELAPFVPSYEDLQLRCFHAMRK